MAVKRNIKTLYTDALTDNLLRELAKASGLSQSEVYRKLVAQAAARAKKEKSAGFLAD
jgi:hypothetical protein